MAYNGSGVFSRLYNWVSDRIGGTPITASRMDAEMDGFATGLSTAICKDGQTTTTAVIPFASGINIAATAPASPSSGDAWIENGGLYMRIGSQTTRVGQEIIETGSKSGANNYQITFPSGFNMIEIEIDNLVALSGSRDIGLRVIDSVKRTTDYAYAYTGWRSSNVTQTGAGSATTDGVIAIGVTTGPASIRLLIPEPDNTARFKPILFSTDGIMGGTFLHLDGGVVCQNNTNALTGVSIEERAALSAITFDYTIIGHR